jgi:uncharacterized protein YndB with AHSA1/START domain
MTDITAQASKTINAKPLDIWEALTRPEKLRQFFFGATIETDWRVGSPIRMKGEHNGRSYEDKGKIISFEPRKKLSFSHWSPLSGAPDSPENYHLVSFELEPKGDSTNVTLSQANLTGGTSESDRQHKADYEKNWRMVLDGLAKVVAQ